jgi:hypothetical protein
MMAAGAVLIEALVLVVAGLLSWRYRAGYAAYLGSRSRATAGAIALTGRGVFLILSIIVKLV